MKLQRNLRPFIFALGFLAGCSSSSPAIKTLIASPTIPENSLFEQSVSAYDRGLFSISRELWTSLRDGYPASYYSTLAELKIADCYFYSADFTNASASYEEFVRAHPGHEAVPYVKFQLANTNFAQYKDELHDQTPLHNAIKAYQQLIDSFPQSEFAPLARRKINRSRELLAQHERYVASFYEKQGFEEASVKRVSQLDEIFPDSDASRQVADETKLINTLADAGIAADPAESSEVSTSKLQRRFDAKRKLAPPPKTPELISPASKTWLSARSGLNVSAAEIGSLPAPSIMESSLISSRTAINPQDQPVARSLNCEELSGFPVVVLNSDRMLTIDLASFKKSNPTDRSVSVILTAAENPDSEAGKNIPESSDGPNSISTVGSVKLQTLSCRSEALSSELTEHRVSRSDGKQERLIELKIDPQRDFNSEIFTVDRPPRVVAVFREKKL